jgi:hypothetical protein
MATKQIPLTHKVISIERAMPDSRGQQPKCSDCSAAAEVTIEGASDVGSGYLDLCSRHLEDRLATKPDFAARMIAGLIRDGLK